MKQTAAVSLGALGLNEDVVQLNEVMIEYSEFKCDFSLKKNTYFCKDDKEATLYLFSLHGLYPSVWAQFVSAYPYYRTLS